MTWVVEERGVGSVVGAEELDAVRAMLASGESLSWGEATQGFEDEFRAYTGAQHAVSVGSCTAALEMAAQVLRLGPEDEVICTPQTFWAGVVALLRRRVRVRFADIEPGSLNIDPRSVEALVTPRTRAIYLVHHGGLPCSLRPIREIARAHRLTVVEDCAHAVGSSYDGESIGSGDICCFSFQSLKNITSLGEGGMFCTNNPEWYREARALRRWGVLGREAPRATDTIGPYRKPSFELHDHADDSWDLDIEAEEFGSHFRLSALQAAVGRVQLRKIDAFLARRSAIAERYTRAIEGLRRLRALEIPSDRTTSWHLYTLLLEGGSQDERDALLRYLQEEHGIRMILRYWPLHLHRAFRARGHAFGECPNCERRWFEQQIHLPISAAMTDAEVDHVIRGLASGVDKVLR